MIHVIAPVCRPELFDRLLANFARQTVPARLVVIENGPAVGMFPRHDDIVVLRSGVQHHAAAKNVALDYLRGQGAGAWTTFDDDDYYGPSYLNEFRDLLELTGADAVGKLRSFIAFDDGLYRFNNERCDQWTEGTINGGAIGAATPNVPDFEVVTNDDFVWCNTMRGLGRRLWASSCWGYCYDRRSTHRHAWNARPVQVRRALRGTAEYFGRLPDSAVDDKTLVPIRLVPEPSDREVLNDMMGMPCM